MAISIVLTLSIPFITVGSAQAEISNPLPADGAIGLYPCCIALSVDISNVTQNNTNLTFSSGGTNITTFYNITNGTYIIHASCFNEYNHTYYWKASVSDDVNATYSFTTSSTPYNTSHPISNESWIVGLAIMFGGLGIILAVRKNRGNRYRM